MNFARFRKPSRYIGNEINMLRKDGDVKIALCFPDTYEIGMSHLGLKILYSIVNNIPDTSAERVFAPWIDFEEYLRKEGLPLPSMENQRPLRDFDIVGFTLQYELSYTNILNMLDLGGIPIKTKDRDDGHPLVIAGGPCAVNPLPLAPFIDAFAIGDGEDLIKEIIEVYRNFNIQNAKDKTRQELLKALSKREGVYVPAVHNGKPNQIKRRIVEDLDRAPFPDDPILPFMSIVHDRIAIEIARGCTRGCRFCQAGMTYRPLRERSYENVLALAEKSIAATGYDEISFTSLSTGDYSCLLPLIRDFNKKCSGSPISVSLPSLRVGSVNSEVLKEIKSVRKTGFTIAPEAGTKRLRDVINKDFTDEEYEETLNRLFSEGWKSIKLYFMIGLPTEMTLDINGLIDMAVKASKIGRKITGRRVMVNVGISAFIPKPHTPFQWVGQGALEDLREKQDYIKRAFKSRGINFKGQHVEHSLLEAVFSRADKKCSPLLEEAWRLGCRFDGWAEHFDFSKWLRAADKTGIDLNAYASRTLAMDDDLPWDFIDTGVRKEFLTSEYQHALKEEITQDCREQCYGCGLECNTGAQSVEHKMQNADVRAEISEHRFRTKVPTRMRVRFSKTGDMRYLSHQELMTAMTRAMRRAHIPLAYSSGFHPHPKISFGPALAVGVEGLSEFFDVEMTALIDTTDFIKGLTAQLPLGLIVHDARLIRMNERALNEIISRYEYEIEIENNSGDHIRSFMNRTECLVARDRKTVDIRPMVEKTDVENQSLRLILVDTDRAKARLYEILKEMLQMPNEELQTLIVKRIRLYGYNSGAYVGAAEKSIGI